MADSRISELTAGTPTATDVIPYTNGTATYKVALGQLNSFGISYIISSLGSATLQPAVECGFSGTIESIRLYSGTTKGNGTIDIYKMTYANLGTGTPGTAFSIVGTAIKPAIAGTNVYQDTTFANWTVTTFSKGDWLIPYVVNSGTITSMTISICGRKLAVS